MAEIIDLCRPLKLSNFVPTLFRISNDLYAISRKKRTRNTCRKQGFDLRRRSPALQRKHGLGAWQVSGIFYGVRMPPSSR
jgi:4-cresol dehydrogenase (hydroxylating)